MQAQKLLTKAELDFIRQLSGIAPAPEPQEQQRLQVDVGSQFRELLSRCAANDQLSLHAHVANQHLAFDLHIGVDEQSVPFLKLRAPQIFDEGDSERGWRSELSEPLPLMNKAGRRNGLWLYQLSNSGALIKCTGQRKAPKQFNALLPVPNAEPIAISGAFVRATDNDLHAYWLHALDAESDERLREFIFAQHCAQDLH
ncbi:hypothetical protein [Pseudomonas sp. 5P_3.1_Bac2]|uniref:hypothetical protein n=1 Tax=Pseudomonas sp. 5P_3.1_Bac2 TaxID=2971617 RepID=UPI0021C5BA66|nr:hypothetical protein [Pseudomonas sp. 5P_3.1_Bac2]MCU1716406.1 hypothetical protein [Pseudomonas sp. 5P_3.1_Bac2]